MPINGHSRKGSLLVGGEGIDIKKGPLAFGSVDSPNPLLSSSPAAPSSIGGHLTNSLQAFGSLPADADSSSAGVTQDPRRSNMTTSATQPPAKKPMDAHSFFMKPNNSATQSQQSQQSQPSPQPQQPQQAQQPQSHPSQMTSPPPMNGHAMPPNQGQYRPQSMMQPGQMRQNGPPSFQPRPMHQQMGPGGPGMPQHYGQHQGMPYGMGGYQGQPYYPGSYEHQQQQQYQMHQWQQQQQQQQQHQRPHSAFMSPRGSATGLPQGQPSPALSAAQLPSNGSVSPAPINANRPSFVPSSAQGPSMPGVSPRPASQATPPVFVPGQNMGANPYMSQPQMTGGSATFTPRKKAPLTFRRPDGSTLDLASATPTKSSAATTPEPTPAPVAPATPAVTTRIGAAIKIESEEAKAKRLAREATEKKMKDEDEKYEQEKKERKEKQAREAEEKRIADEAKAKEDAAVKETEEKIAEEKRKADEAADKEAASKKQADEETASKAAKDESDKAQAAAAVENKSTLATPSASAAASPAASPNPAGLPAKPSSTVRRTAPTPLELKASSSKPADAQPSAMLTAKPITDLSTVNYNAPIQSPSADLNKDAQPGKFRYDRDFLMQFMAICQEKPDRLPPLEEIGLEAESSSGFGKRGSGRTSSGGPHARNGLGISGSRGSSMGSFGTGGTGAFGSGQIGNGIRGTTSQDRYNQSLKSAGGRSSSQHGMPPPRAPRPASNRGGRRPVAPPVYEPDVAPLQTTENSWVNSRPGKETEDPRSATFVARKVKALLNKLTEEKFDSISGKIIDFANYSVDETNGQSLKLVIKLIFEKATDEAHWSAMYAKLCKKMLESVDPAVTENLDGKDVAGPVLFRKYLIGRCQQDFETGWKEREDAAQKAAQKKDDDKAAIAEHAAGEGAEPAVLSDEYYAAQKAKRRGLGLVQLIGELFKLDMINKNVMKQCFLKLLGNVDDTDEEDIESACKLLTTIGAVYDAQSRENVDGIMKRLLIIKDADSVSSRVKFMILDLEDLRKAHWKGKQAATSVMTIAEVHQQAAREQAQKAASTQQSMSRGGSRAGQQRGGGPGDWQTTPSQAPRQRPTDFSHMGRLNSTNNVPNFQPQSAFGKNKRNGPNASTPPISRQPSQANIANANAFALLHDTEAAETTEAAPQRKKLNLAPRTKPVAGEEGEGEGEGEAEQTGESGSGESDEEIHTPAQSSMMTESAALAKIKLDVAELWGEKGSGGSRNPEDIVHYFKALPEPRRPLLATQLFDDVFRLSKLKDAQIIGKGLGLALDEGVAGKEVLITGFETRIATLDDESIDFPAAYKAVASIIRSLSMSTEEIDSLVGKIEVYGEPRITPKMKLDKAFAQLDEEAAQA